MWKFPIQRIVRVFEFGWERIVIVQVQKPLEIHTQIGEYVPLSLRLLSYLSQTNRPS